MPGSPRGCLTMPSVFAVPAGRVLRSLESLPPPALPRPGRCPNQRLGSASGRYHLRKGKMRRSHAEIRNRQNGPAGHWGLAPLDRLPLTTDGAPQPRIPPMSRIPIVKTALRSQSCWRFHRANRPIASGYCGKTCRLRCLARTRSHRLQTRRYSSPSLRQIGAGRQHRNSSNPPHWPLPLKG